MRSSTSSEKFCSIYSEICFKTDHLDKMDSGDIYLEFNNKSGCINDDKIMTLLSDNKIDTVYLLISCVDEELSYKIYYIEDDNEYSIGLYDLDPEEENIILGILVKKFIFEKEE